MCGCLCHDGEPILCSCFIGCCNQPGAPRSAQTDLSSHQKAIAIEAFKKYKFPMIKKASPALIANQICRVQPMAQPIRSSYDEQYQIMDYVDDMLCAGMFDRVNKEISELVPVDMTVDAIVAWLVITLCAKNKLPSRKDFVKRAETYLVNKFDEEQKDAIMHGLY